MEELTIWEQHTITLNKDPKLGFGFALSGGKDKPHPDNGDTAVMVSDVLPNGPAMGRLFTKDLIVMVNGTSMENVHSNYTIQILKSCGKTANVTVKRPRKIQIPATTRPSRSTSHSNLLDQDPPRRTRRYSDSSDNRDSPRYRATPDHNGHGNTMPLMSSGYKRLPHQNTDKHPLLDITPTAVERLNYIQYHPMVLFLDPHSRKDVKAMRQRYSPNSTKSSRRLYSQALKMRKHCSHLFSARVDLQPNSNIWYESLKDKIRHQQSKPVWVSEVTLEAGGEQDLDTLDQTQSDYLSAASDLEDTDGEAFTDGEPYTDNEDLEEAYPGQEAARLPQGSRAAGAALARSSEPASGHHSPAYYPEPHPDTYSLREIPPLMHVPEPRSTHQNKNSPTNSDAEEEEEPSHRSFTDSDFNTLDVIPPTTPSDGPPDFRAPDPPIQHSANEPSYVQTESPQQATLSAIEEKLQQARAAEPQAESEEKKSPQFIVLAHHHQAVQFRRTQIRGSDSSDEDDEDEEDDIEWGPATEL
uniref:Tight junction protein 3 n=1 Tax=Echeneis naucrates TaxID=173247 RepID=A0A665T9U5_ECHNA